MYNEGNEMIHAYATFQAGEGLQPVEYVPVKQVYV
jgi:hypothetical protein